MMTSPPFEIGHHITRTLTLTEDEIVAGARFLEDRNPLHNDTHSATRSRFGALIACGPHVSGIHACMLPTHCTESGYDVVGTVFTVRYTGPVCVDVVHDLTWAVTAMTPHRSGGHLVDWTGTVTSRPEGRSCIEATGQVLVTSRSG